MRNTARLLALIVALLLPALAFGQSAPAKLPAQTVYGRLGVPGDTGPGQAIPFPVLAAQLGSAGASNVALYGALPNDNTKAAANQAAFAKAFAASSGVSCSSNLVYYVQKITIPTTATMLNGCNLVAAGNYAGGDGVVSVVNNTTGFTFTNGSISANGFTYPNTAGILVTGSTNVTIQNSSFELAAKTIVSSNNTNIRVLYNTITSYIYNVFFDSGGSTGVWIIGNTASGPVDTANLVWNDNTFIVVGGFDVTMQYNTVLGTKFWAFSVQSTNHFNISNNIAKSGIRECITAGGELGIVSNNECFFEETSTDYCMSFSGSYIDVTDNLCFEPAFTGFYFFNELGGSLVGNTVNTPVTTDSGAGWMFLSLDGTTTGMMISNNSINDFHGTLASYYYKAGGTPTGNCIFGNLGPTPLFGVFNNGLDPGTCTFNSQNIQTTSLLLGSGATSALSASSTNTGFQNGFIVQNGGTLSNSGTIALLATQLTAGTSAQVQMIASGGASPSGQIVSGTGLTGGLNIVAAAGTLSLTSPTLTNPTVTGSFTATGLLHVSDLATASKSVTVNGQTCTLAGTCTVTASAGAALTFGTHLAAGGTSYNGSTAVTITSDATAANTASTIMARDGSGQVAATTFTGTFNGNTFTAGTGTLTIAAGKTLTESNTLTFTGTDGSSVAFGAGGTVGMLGATQTWTGSNTFNLNSHYAVVGGTGAGFWLNSVTTGTDRWFFGSDAAIADSFRIFSALAGGNMLQVNASATAVQSSAIFAGSVGTGTTTVAGLPSCSASFKGTRHYVTDATQALTAGIGATVAGSGSNNVPVVCDGTNWRIGANDNVPTYLVRKYA